MCVWTYVQAHTCVCMRERERQRRKCSSVIDQPKDKALIFIFRNIKKWRHIFMRYLLLLRASSLEFTGFGEWCSFSNKSQVFLCIKKIEGVFALSKLIDREGVFWPNFGPCLVVHFLSSECEHWLYNLAMMQPWRDYQVSTWQSGGSHPESRASEGVRRLKHISSSAFFRL